MSSEPGAGQFNVPNRQDFWNGLYENANARFYLIGKTNKSWITKNSEQPVAFASSIIRIIHGGGDVRILSDDDPAVVTSTREFIDRSVIPELRKLPTRSKETIVNLLRARFVYAVTSSSHYRAVVSDDRLVFIPSLNSVAFRDEALVFELTKHEAPFEFHTYMSDVDRMFEEESTNIPINWN